MKSMKSSSMRKQSKSHSKKRQTTKGKIISQAPKGKSIPSKPHKGKSLSKPKTTTPLLIFGFDSDIELQKIKSKLLELKDSKRQAEIAKKMYMTIQYVNRGDDLIRCLLIIDFMIKLPNYYAQFEYYISGIYYDIYRKLLFMNPKFEQDAKIFRKYWLGRIKYEVYAIIKSLIESLHKVQLDVVREDALPSIKKYYQEVLKLNEEELLYHLPQLKTINLTKKASPVVQLESKPILKLNKKKVEEERVKIKKQKGVANAVCLDQASIQVLPMKQPKLKIQASKKKPTEVAHPESAKRKKTEEPPVVKATKKFKQNPPENPFPQPIPQKLLTKRQPDPRVKCEQSPY